MSGESEKKRFLSGEPVGAEIMAALLRENFSRAMLQSRMHFVQPFPDYKRSAGKLFTLRLCRYQHLQKPLTVQAAFDGILSKRILEDGDWIIGSYNSINRINSSLKQEIGGFSIIFFLNLIRLEYCHSIPDGSCKEIYYHIPYAPEGVLLHMVRALDTLIHEITPCREEGCRLMLEALGQQVLYKLQQSAGTGFSARAASWRIKNYMEHNFTGNINCSSVCDTLKINRSYGSTVFREDFGISMADFLLKLRMDAAKNLLASKDRLKVVDVAHFCGFNDTGYFIRVFRRQTGMTPGEFRKK